MRIYNARLAQFGQGKWPGWIPAEPDVHHFDLYGHSMFLDANSLVLMEAESPTEETALNTPPARPSMGSLLWWPFKPNYPVHPAGGARTVVLGLTNECNLACTYCFVRNYRPDQSRTMSFGMAARVVSRFMAEGVTFGFFGGEATLHWDRMVQITEHIEAVRKARGFSPQSFHLTTNATLVTPERAKWLKAHNFSLIVSLDGPRDLHNAARPAKDGTDSWEATVGGLKCLHEAGLSGRLTLRSTFTAQSLHLVDRLSVLNGLLRDGLASHVSVEPVSLNEAHCLRLPDGHGQSMAAAEREALTDEYHKAAEWTIAEIKAGRKVRWHHMYKPWERIIWSIHSPTECGAGNGYITVGADGEIYACHREGKSAIGHMDYGIDESRRAAWLDNRWYGRSGCANCWRRNLCGGGCRMDSIDRSGELRRPDNCWLRGLIWREAVWALAELGLPTVIQLVPDPKGPRMNHGGAGRGPGRNDKPRGVCPAGARNQKDGVDPVPCVH